MKHVTIAAPLFTCPHTGRDDPRSRQAVLAQVQQQVEQLHGTGVDLVVFCEGVEAYAQTTDQAEALEAPGELLSLYQRLAREQRLHIAGSAKVARDGRVFNALVFIGPAGEILGCYCKNYLTDGELEQGLSPGDGPVVVETPIGRLGGIVCFDLNFEPLRRQYAALKPDILVFPSMYHGGLVQGIWAYSCRSFFAAALYFHGGAILDPFGQVLASTDCYNAIARATVNLDRVMAHIDFNREKLQRAQRAYGKELRIETPANIGAMLLYSESDKRTAAQIAEEFEIQLLDDYFRASMQHNDAQRGARRAPAAAS